MKIKSEIYVKTNSVTSTLIFPGFAVYSQPTYTCNLTDIQYYNAVDRKVHQHVKYSCCMTRMFSLGTWLNV